MIKGSLKEEDIIFLNIYAANIGVPKYIKQILTDIKGEVDNNVRIAEDCNTPLTMLCRSFRQKISKETVALNDTLDHWNIINIYRTFHPKTAEYTFFSSVHGIFTDRSHARSPNNSQQI